MYIGRKNRKSTKRYLHTIQLQSGSCIPLVLSKRYLHTAERDLPSCACERQRATARRVHDISEGTVYNTAERLNGNRVKTNVKFNQI